MKRLVLLVLIVGLTVVGCRPVSDSSPAAAGRPPESVTTDAASPPVSPAESAPGDAPPGAMPGLEDVADRAGDLAQSAAGIAQEATPGPPSTQLVPVTIPLPAPAFRGTPVPGTEPFVEEPSGRPRAPFLAPAGTENLALGKPVTCSDLSPAAGETDYVTDGVKEASDSGCLELASGTQWVQIDLGQSATVYAVVVWHNHAEARVYRDVVVQVSDDPDFLPAFTVFNNDYDNSSGLGVGPAIGYVETSEGRLIDCRGVEGRYVRLYSRGNHLDDKNHYTEVDVYGRT